MEKEVLDNYIKAGAIWKKAIQNAQKKAKEGKVLFELAEEIESFVKEEEGEVAFPVNLSINEQAAHYTPKWKDTYALSENDLLKIDIGVCVDGYICDGAVSVNLNNVHSKQIEANELALENAISVTEKGKTIEDIGSAIENTLKEKGYNPVFNLGGHGLGKNDIHSYPSIPNHANSGKVELKEGMCLAIEPFSSTGKGYISEDANVEIFSLQEKKGARNPAAKQILALAQKYEGRPFAERWIRKELEGKVNDFNITFGLRELMKNNALHAFHGLKEHKDIFVTQAEKTVILTESNTIVLGE